jgi:hypothetical protein
MYTKWISVVMIGIICASATQNVLGMSYLSNLYNNAYNSYLQWQLGAPAAKALEGIASDTEYERIIDENYQAPFYMSIAKKLSFWESPASYVLYGSKSLLRYINKAFYYNTSYFKTSQPFIFNLRTELTKASNEKYFFLSEVALYLYKIFSGARRDFLSENNDFNGQRSTFGVLGVLNDLDTIIKSNIQHAADVINGKGDIGVTVSWLDDAKKKALGLLNSARQKLQDWNWEPNVGISAPPGEWVKLLTEKEVRELKEASKEIWDIVAEPYITIFDDSIKSIEAIKRLSSVERGNRNSMIGRLAEFAILKYSSPMQQQSSEFRLRSERGSRKQKE